MARVLGLVCGLRWGLARKERCRRDLPCHEQQRVSTSKLVTRCGDSSPSLTSPAASMAGGKASAAAVFGLYRERLRLRIFFFFKSRWYGGTGDEMREIAYFGADLRGARCAGVVPFGTTFFLEAGAETAGGVVSGAAVDEGSTDGTS